MGEISYGKGALIGVIESKIKKSQADGRNGAYPAWERGFGRMPENTPEHWEVMA